MTDQSGSKAKVRGKAIGQSRQSWMEGKMEGKMEHGGKMGGNMELGSIFLLYDTVCENGHSIIHLQE